MRNYEVKKGSYSSRLWGLVMVSWILFSLYGPLCQDIACQIRLAFGLASAASAVAVLNKLAKARLLHPESIRYDLLTTTLVVPTAALVQYGVFNCIFQIQVCTVTSIILVAGMVVISSCAINGILQLLIGGDAKFRVVMDVLPQEKERFIRDIVDNGWNLDNYEFLTRNDLRKAILNGTASNINLVVISREAVGGFDPDGALVMAHLDGIPVVDFHNLEADITGRVRLAGNDQWSFILEATKQTFLLRAYAKAKMILEPIAAAVMLVAFSPLFLLIAALIKHSSKGPVFYKQVRTGYLGRTFTLIKFRSMREDAEANGPQWCSGDTDDRITPIGSFLRKTRLDELPQLINVIRGEMGFFGPRPERPEMYAKIKKEVPLFKMRTLIRPGVTGWAQVGAGYAATIEESKTKLEYDLYYIKRMTPLMDIVVLFKTIMVAVCGEKKHSHDELAVEVPANGLKAEGE